MQSADTRHASWSNGTELRTGLSRYVVVGSIGASSHAESHMAYEILPDAPPRSVAILRLLPGDGRNWNERRDRFLQRAKIGARLDHPYLTVILDRGEHAGVPFLVRETSDDLNLRALAAFAERKIPVPVACEIGRQLADALVYIHNVTDKDGASMGLVHGEVSPSNISVDRSGMTRITEAGASRISALTSLGCAPPEQVRGEPLDGRADLFSLGVVIVELLSGSSLAPTGRLDFASLHNEVRARCDARSDVPDALTDMLLWLTALDSTERPDSAADLSVVLGDVQQSFGGRPDLAVALGPIFERSTPPNRPSQLPSAQGSRPAQRPSAAPRPSRPSAQPPSAPPEQRHPPIVDAPSGHADTIDQSSITLDSGPIMTSDSGPTLDVSASSAATWVDRPVPTSSEDTMDREVQRFDPRRRYGLVTFGLLLIIAGLLVLYGDLL